MERYFVVLIWGSLFYVEYRWGLTPNRAFIALFFVSATISAYHSLWLIGSVLVGLKSSKLLTHPIMYYRRKLLICIIITGLSFYGFYRTKIPGQIEAYKAMFEAKIEEMFYEEMPDTPAKDSNKDYEKYDVGKKEKRVDEISMQELERKSKKVDSKEMLKEITTGWNKDTADTENDNTNWEKATDLVKKYPNYILGGHELNVKASKALEEPWKYYGKVLRFKGQIYGIQQLPAENSVAQFFDGSCYHAMIVANDNRTPVAISAYIVGNSESVAENSVVSVRGYVYGQSKLVNSAGSTGTGIAFVGFKE